MMIYMKDESRVLSLINLSEMTKTGTQIRSHKISTSILNTTF